MLNLERVKDRKTTVFWKRENQKELIMGKLSEMTQGKLER